MKVLLVQQDMGIRESEYPLYPIGLTYIAGALRDHDVRLFDPNVFPVDRALGELEGVVRDFKPQVVGLSIRNIDTVNYRQRHIHFNTVRPTIQAIKRVDPAIRVMVGGSGFSLFPKAIMERVPEIDFGVYLDGEDSARELLASLDRPEQVKGIFFRSGEEILFTGSRPMLETIPSPRIDAGLIDMRPYLGPSYNIIGIQSKRGCVCDCAYCCYPEVSGRKMRPRSPVEVVDQIEYMVKEFGVKRFVFVDNIFNVPQSHAVAVCEEMIRRSLNVEFGVWCHPKNITEDFLNLLKRAGAVQIDFSPDAATNKGLAALRKGLTEGDIKKVIALARKVKGVGFGFGMFTSLPGYTLKDTIKTLLMPIRIQLALPGRGGGGITYIRIEPHTGIWERAVQEGMISRDESLLPLDDRDLARMFYRPKSQRHLNLITDLYLDFFERLMKPTAVALFRLVGRVRKKPSVYDQKTGFVAYQRNSKKAS